MNALEPAVD